MIEPVRSGELLLDEIRSTTPGPGSIAIWWLGQSGFLIKSARVTLLVDPYLSEYLTRKYDGTDRPHTRMTRAPLRGRDLSRLDMVLASHKHSDHLDPETIPDLLAGSPNASLVLPSSLIEHAIGLGLPRERIVGLVSGQVYERSGIAVRAIPSAHERLDRDDGGRHLYLGFVIEVGGLHLYHSGDSLAYDGLAEAIGPEPIDVMFLPINGRDPARGVAGNMNAVEAVDLANTVRPRFVVPHHYDMFTFNTVPVSVFEAESRRLAAGVRARVLGCGERWEVTR
jgi:L-ascorbate metabolism protein UlaG (beta-lactamase superfamily)